MKYRKTSAKMSINATGIGAHIVERLNNSINERQ